MNVSKLLSFSLILAGLLALFACGPSLNASDAYVTIDINPSIELVVSPRNKVVYANALNEDAEILLSAIDVIGMDLEEAIDLIIETAIELGFIDVAEEGIDVQVVTLASEAIRARIHQLVKARINRAFEQRGVMGRAIDKAFPEALVEEADAYGVTPGLLLMAKSVLLVSDDYVLEELLELDMNELMDILKGFRDEQRQIAVQLRENFLAERDALRAIYQPQIQALEEQLEQEGADTEAIQSEIDALKETFSAELDALRNSYLDQAQLIREQVQSIAEQRRAMHHEAMEAFRNQMQARRQQMIERIKEYQNKRP